MTEFDHPVIASLYDFADPDRRDLERYLQIVDERGARSVIDVGCGAGLLALRPARQGSTSSQWTPPVTCSTWPEQNREQRASAGCTAMSQRYPRSRRIW